MSGNLIRCQNGHLFSSRRYGTVCPYCNIETATKEKKSVEKSQEEIEDISVKAGCKEIVKAGKPGIVRKRK